MAQAAAGRLWACFSAYSEPLSADAPSPAVAPVGWCAAQPSALWRACGMGVCCPLFSCKPSCADTAAVLVASGGLREEQEQEQEQEQKATRCLASQS